MRAIGLTDVGITRSNNEDYFAIVEACQLYVVADGMGGYHAGEIAAELAVKTIVDRVESQLPTSFDTSVDEILDQANNMILTYVKENPNCRGMGTTVVVVFIDKDVLHLANVGDSRCYGISTHSIIQLSKDHSLVEELVKIGSITKEEAERHPDKNIITSALGVDKSYEVFKETYKTSDFKYLLMCSDGLTNMVDTDTIFKLFNAVAFEELPLELVKHANDNGGKDNITVVCIEL